MTQSSVAIVRIPIQCIESLIHRNLVARAIDQWLLHCSSSPSQLNLLVDRNKESSIESMTSISCRVYICTLRMSLRVWCNFLAAGRRVESGGYSSSRKPSLPTE